MGLYLFKYIVEDEYIRKKIKSKKRNPDGFEIIQTGDDDCGVSYDFGFNNELNECIRNFIRVIEHKYGCYCDSVQRSESDTYCPTKGFRSYYRMYEPVPEGIIEHMFKIDTLIYRLSEKFI